MASTAVWPDGSSRQVSGSDADQMRAIEQSKDPVSGPYDWRLPLLRRSRCRFFVGRGEHAGRCFERLQAKFPKDRPLSGIEGAYGDGIHPMETLLMRRQVVESILANGAIAERARD
jgi:hypothetical protein